MGENKKHWKVVYFPSDETFTLVNSKSAKIHMRNDDETKVSVKFGQKWFEGEIVTSSATKKQAEEALLQLSASHDEGKKIEITYFMKCSNLLKCFSHIILCSDYFIAECCD